MVLWSLSAILTHLIVITFIIEKHVSTILSSPAPAPFYTPLYAETIQNDMIFFIEFQKYL